jgi:methionine salvage enolase-phosphatase E1
VFITETVVLTHSLQVNRTKQKQNKTNVLLQVKARLPAWLQRHPHAACVEKAAQGWNIMPEQVSDRCVQLMESDSKDGLLKLIQAEVMKEGWEKVPVNVGCLC